MTGIKDVAERAGLSVATVSRALSGKGNVSPASRERARSAAAELGFVLSYHASSLASGRTHNVGLVVPSVHRWFFSAVIEGASAALLEAGYDLTLYNIGENPEHRKSVFNDFLLRKRVDAVIAVSLELSEDEIQQLHAVHRPIVGIGGPLPGASTIRIDDSGIALKATNHLLGLGHTKIAHITGLEAYDQDFRLPGTRRSGFEKAMDDAGCPVRPEWIVSADFTIEGAYAAARQLLASAPERPTAVFAASDEMAIGTILAARDFGLRIPEDLSVMGIDGHDLGKVLGLTTIDQDAKGQGALAVRTLLGAINNGLVLEPADTRHPTKLVVRTSTAVPKASGS
ncbi:LacI family DNA-binding transcriptional regulator [Paenarthrobacter aurescens]|uniref:LacI family transcriptional regulator n=1 Tax=Paenarthrobacter aurescens TaxID=43663 RepID=A0A4Y3NP75_PAEAU|nr:LacI family DNA-binding transcriptional regulator [Paenarthrobacter aurescens]UKA50757.1 LacI family transcriptional regulator [Arthrobacter sp. FW305-123]MDO6142481.1 LacI family transcriptional regulator [Paenarthrobacter aurescens]MDO6146328.1 LacI family transcriptional regulator [Paenarthrobacter aurescens]MDO6157573.1 LacI family transcriptional regulator [Paenarthrobacter aurescens]MDO6161558.1 LacI family transcriptional regulator [Paenarthrobacter aurescens]